jgi:hypothetical protein
MSKGGKIMALEQKNYGQKSKTFGFLITFFLPTLSKNLASKLHYPLGQ